MSRLQAIRHPGAWLRGRFGAEEPPEDPYDGALGLAIRRTLTQLGVPEPIRRGDLVEMPGRGFAGYTRVFVMEAHPVAGRPGVVDLVGFEYPYEPRDLREFPAVDVSTLQVVRPDPGPGDGR